MVSTVALGVPVGIPDRRSRSPEELRLLWYQIGDEGYRGTSAPENRLDPEGIDRHS